MEILNFQIKGPITECGIPHAGRVLILDKLKNYQKILWVSHPARPGSVYPPSWQNFDLEKFWFISAEQVMQEMKPVFLDTYFDVVVLDSFRNLRQEDLAFLALQARKLNFQIILIRDYFLTTKLGNVWARSRLNIFFLPERRTYKIQSVRGFFT